MQVEHEVHQRPLQLRTQVPIDGEARARQLDRAFQIEDAELGAQVPVRLRSEIKLGRRAPAPHFDILLGAVADRHAGMRQIRNARQNIAQPGIEIRRSFLQRLNLLAQILGLGHGGAGVLPALFQLRDFFRRFIPLRLAGLSLSNSLAALRVNFAKVLQHGSRIHAALAQLFFHQRQVVANEIQIKHGN